MDELRGHVHQGKLLPPSSSFTSRNAPPLHCQVVKGSKDPNAEEWIKEIEKLG